MSNESRENHEGTGVVTGGDTSNYIDSATVQQFAKEMHYRREPIQ